MTLVRMWNMAGGGIPVGVWPLLLALVGWPILLYKVIRPIGVFRDRSPLPWLSGGWVLALVLHLVLRSRMTQPQPAALMFWPSDESKAPGVAAAFARLEEALRPAAARQELRWQGDVTPLLITQHLLESGRMVPSTAEEAFPLMEALELRLMLSHVAAPGGGRVVLWRKEWGQCTREDEEIVASPGGAQELEQALRALLKRQVDGVSLELAAWRPEQQALYGPVADSAALWLALPQGDLPPHAFLRRTSLLLNLEGARPELAPQVEKAVALAEQIPALGAEPWVLAGDWFARAGQWEEARQAVANALSREAAHPLIYWQLGHMAPSRLKEFGFARRADALAQCVARQPAFLPAVRELARERSLARQSGQAVPAVERALVCYPQDAELWLLRGNLAWETMDHATAQESWQRSARLRPGDSRPWMNLGQQQLGLRQFAKAIPLLEKAVALGSPPLMLHLLGLAHLELGHAKEARVYLERRLELGGSVTELASTQRLLARVADGGNP